MNDSDHHKPVPARAAPEPARGKPTPARELTGEAPPPPPEADVPESSFVVDGVEWSVRVLGRSGSASSASPPLLLLGFWEGGGEGEPAREALVVGRALADFSEEQLEGALAASEEPPDPARKRTFFAESGQSRRR